MLQDKNRIINFFWGVLACGLYLLFFYKVFNKASEVVFLKANRLEISYFFATIPIHLWIFSIFLFGTIFFISGGKLNVPSRFKGSYMSTIPIAALFLSIVIGFFFKPLLIEHLHNNGYELKEIVKASRPWYFDKYIYIKSNI